MLKKTIIALMFCVLTVSCSSTTTSSITFETTDLTITTSTQTLSLTVEVADTAAKRAQGLMDRTSLDADAGMLFVNEEDTETSFWMRNTTISLDILFINADKEIIYIIENTTPLSEEAISAGLSYRYALEVNAGYTSENTVNVGDVISFSN